MDKHLVDELVPPGECSLEDDLFPRMIRNGTSFYALPLPGCFIDVGVPKGYAEAVQFLEKLGA